MMTVLEALERRLDPKYVGWEDQYKGVLTALGIPLDMSMDDLQELLSLYTSDREL